MVGRPLGGSGSALGSRGWVGIGVGVGGRAAVTPAAVLGFGGVAGTKVMGIRSPMLDVVVMVVCRGATVCGVALGLGVGVCWGVVLMALFVLVRSFRSTSMKVSAAVMGRCHGAGCRSATLVGATCLPLALDCSALAAVSSSMASMTQV